MKVKLSKDCDINIYKENQKFDLKHSFFNYTSEYIKPPSKIYHQNKQYYSTIEDCFLYGSRYFLKDNSLFIDTPLEWSEEETLSYLSRVSVVHKKEMPFFEEINLSDGYINLVPRRHISVIDCDCVHVGSVEFWNFGFFIGVVAYKCYIADLLFPGKPVLVPIINSWQKNLLLEFFPKIKFVFYSPDHPVKLKRVINIGWPNFGFFFEKSFKSIFECKNNWKFSSGAMNKIYLSRGKINSSSDRVGFSEFLERKIIRKGYKVVYPENHNFNEMKKILSDVDVVLMNSGSALFNCLLANSDSCIHLVESRENFLNNHTRAISSCVNNANIHFCNESSVDLFIDNLP